MEGFVITPGDMRLFKASFRDTECIVCGHPLYVGDQIGWLNYRKPLKRFGPLCVDCLHEEGVPFDLRETKK